MCDLMGMLATFDADDIYSYSEKTVHNEPIQLSVFYDNIDGKVAIRKRKCDEYLRPVFIDGIDVSKVFKKNINDDRYSVEMLTRALQHFIMCGQKAIIVMPIVDDDSIDKPDQFRQLVTVGLIRLVDMHNANESLYADIIRSKTAMLAMNYAGIFVSANDFDNCNVRKWLMVPIYDVDTNLLQFEPIIDDDKFSVIFHESISDNGKSMKNICVQQQLTANAQIRILRAFMSKFFFSLIDAETVAEYEEMISPCQLPAVDIDQLSIVDTKMQKTTSKGFVPSILAENRQFDISKLIEWRNRPIQYNTPPMVSKITRRMQQEMSEAQMFLDDKVQVLSSFVSSHLSAE